MIVPAVAGAARRQCAIDHASAHRLLRPARADLSRRLFPVRRGLHRLHDLHDRLCPRRRRRRRGAEPVLGPDRHERLRDALGLAARAGARPRRACHHHHPRHQRDRRGLPIFGHSPLLLAISALVFGVAFFAVVGSTTAFVRFNYPPSEAGRAGIAAMTIAFGIGQTLGPIAVGADHGCAGQPVLCAERVRRAAGARRDPGGVSAEVGEEIVGWAKARLRRAHRSRAHRTGIRRRARSLCPPYAERLSFR